MSDTYSEMKSREVAGWAEMSPVQILSKLAQDFDNKAGECYISKHDEDAKKYRDAGDRIRALSSELPDIRIKYCR